MEFDARIFQAAAWSFLGLLIVIGVPVINHIQSRHLSKEERDRENEKVREELDIW